jgi:hypothetical protein
MKKEITLGQVLAVAATFIIAIVTGWITMSNKVTDAERRISTLEAQRVSDNIEYRQSISELKWQIADGNQKTTDQLTHILVKLENKQNRKQ